MENEISNADTEDLDYDEYAKSLSDVKLEGMDSSYAVSYTHLITMSSITKHIRDLLGEK